MALTSWSKDYKSVQESLTPEIRKRFPEDVKVLEEFINSGEGFLVLDGGYEPFKLGRVAIVTKAGTDKTISSESFTEIFRPCSCDSRVEVRA